VLVPGVAISRHRAVVHGRRKQMKEALLLFGVVVLGTVVAIYILPPFGKPTLAAATSP
jgi:hypothetical protein